MKVLQLTAHYHPNLGGVETHLLDLAKGLVKKRIEVFVLTYQPLTSTTRWLLYEKSTRLWVLRLPWVSGLFYKLVSKPALEFLYLFPGLLVATPFVIFFFRPNVIHAHGLVAAVVAVFWGNIFGTKVVVSLHSIYNFPRKGIYRTFVRLILSAIDKVLCLSDQSVNEIINLGVSISNIIRFTYWIDLNNFKRDNKAKVKLRLIDTFVVLFVGRLIKEKGVEVLLNSVKTWNKKINLLIVGEGPLKDKIITASVHNQRIKYLGRIDQSSLPLYYSAADLLIVPSVSEEGFGRVVLESLACGTPILGSDKGAIKEAINQSVGEIVPINPQNITSRVNFYYNNRSALSRLSKMCRYFARLKYSERNINQIVKCYGR